MRDRAGTGLLLLLAALAVAGWFLSRDGEDPTAAPLPQPAAPEAKAPAAPPAVPPEAVAGPGPERAAAGPERTAPAALPAQGFRGLAIDANDRPLAGLQVYLQEPLADDPLAAARALQSGLLPGPLAAATTGADGTFAIGLPVAFDRPLELRLAGAGFADTTVAGLRILAGVWSDLGALRMVPGAVVRGRVTIAGNPDLPVPQAVVTLQSRSAFADLAERALPDREGARHAAADALGRYELRQVPSQGLLTLSAVAPGFARVVRSGVQVDPTRPVEVDFALPPGLQLAGRVTGRDGAPLAGARLEAWPQQAAGEPLAAESAADGSFAVLGLVAGTYRLRVRAEGWQELQVPGLLAGRTDLDRVLQPMQAVRVRVTDPGGQVLRRYELGLRRYFADRGGQIGHVAEVHDAAVRLDGYTDWALLRAVPNGTFVCQVTAPGFAPTLSPPFAVGAEAAAEPLAIEVAVGYGGTLRGRVLDEDGVPLAGATVVTQPDGFDGGDPVRRILAGAAPRLATEATATTDRDGAFTLARLAHAAYQLQIDHPAACRTVVPGLDLRASAELLVPPVRLPVGAEVTGQVTVGGKIAGQCKVVVTRAAMADGPQGTASLRVETATDDRGAFRLPQRLPPGNYVLRAAVVGSGPADAQIFQQLLQLQRSSTTFSVAPGQRHCERLLDLPTEH